MTTMVTVAVSLPPVLLAVMVYAADAVMAVGVPLMAPVEESKDNPAGSDGEIDQLVIVPPFTVGVAVVMAVPLVKLNVLGLYVRDEGATSLTTIVTVTVSLPPVLVAVMVYEADVVTAVGVPLIAPVEESRASPAGRDGDVDHEVTVPPVEVGVAVVMAVPFVSENELGLYETFGVTSLTTMVTVVVSLPPVLLAVIV